MFETRKLSKFGKQVLNTRKQKAFVHVRDVKTIQPSYWQEGSRTLTHALILPDMTVKSLSQIGVKVVDSPFTATDDEKVTLTESLAIIESGHFCGKEATPAITVVDEELIADLFV